MLAILAQRSVSLNINWKHRILSPVLCRSHSVSVSVGDSELQLSTGQKIEGTTYCGFVRRYLIFQINCKPLSLDDDSDGVLLGINAAVAAIHVSSVPFDGPVGAVRLALVDGKIVINPSRHVLKESKLDMVLAGCSGQRTVMVEMDGEEVSLDEIQIALSEGFESIDKILYGMNELREISGKKKENLCAELYPPNLINEIRQLCDERLYYVLTDITHDKTSRDNAIKEIGADVLKSLSNRDPATTMDAFSFIVKQVLRCDGRSLKDFRPITINVDVYKKLHGSALFQRGQTQVLSTVTFDSPAAAFHPDSISQLLGAQRKKMFMLHYEFPGYATNEISSSRSVNRREQGHGALAEKALKHVVPKDFPYSIRLACQEK
uniref:Polyribonucleotide nucleotidyltransferase n=1 Tax=Heterorhabditis bacteriophora TaxID=37862 RepID=A0A1I7XUT1_HETBA